MSQKEKALLKVALGFIVAIGLSYTAFAFLKAESNPFLWPESTRFIMLWLLFSYICFTPVLIQWLIDE